MDYKVHGILQARLLEWAAFPFSRWPFQPRDRTQVSLLEGKFFTSWATREAQRKQKKIIKITENNAIFKKEKTIEKINEINSSWFFEKIDKTDKLLAGLTKKKQIEKIQIIGLPQGLNGKESTCPWRRHGFDPWARKIPWRRKWQPIPVSLPGKSHGQRSLAGYSPWDHKELGMTQRLKHHQWQILKLSTEKSPSTNTFTDEFTKYLKNEHKFFTLPKKMEEEGPHPNSMSPVLSWYQNQRYHSKIKLETKNSYSHKNLQ